MKIDLVKYGARTFLIMDWIAFLTDDSVATIQSVKAMMLD